MSWDDNFFDNLEFEDVEYEINGALLPVKVPIVERSMSRITVFVLIDAEKAQALLPSSVVPASELLMNPFPEGKTVLQVSVSEKYEVDGIQELPYTEVWIGIPVNYQDQLMYYTLQCLGTTAESVAGVKAVWNFPSFLCEVTKEETEDAITNNVEADGQHLLTITIPKCPTTPMNIPTTFVSVNADGEIKTVEGLQNLELGRSDVSDSSLEFGDHPVADQLKDLEIGPIISSLYTPKIQMWLGAAK
jgi:hypothetical protein